MNMILFLAVTFVFALTGLAADYGTAANGARLPDPAVTPGAVLPVDAKTVCVPGYSKSVRNVPESIKKLAYKKYGVKPKRGVCCEVDHLISLELGGSNDIENLWPQPWSPSPGAREKDAVENALHANVCAGALPLAEAQKLIAKDWTTALVGVYFSHQTIPLGHALWERHCAGCHEAGSGPKLLQSSWAKHLYDDVYAMDRRDNSWSTRRMMGSAIYGWIGFKCFYGIPGKMPSQSRMGIEEDDFNALRLWVTKRHIPEWPAKAAR